MFTRRGTLLPRIAVVDRWSITRRRQRPGPGTSSAIGPGEPGGGGDGRRAQTRDFTQAIVDTTVAGRPSPFQTTPG